MAQVNFNIDPELDEEFRRMVFEKKGMRRGSITDAFHEALRLWIREQQNTKKFTGFK